MSQGGRRILHQLTCKLLILNHSHTGLSQEYKSEAHQTPDESSLVLGPSVSKSGLEVPFTAGSLDEEM